MKVHLNITQSHINLGQPKEADRCPIALALREAMPDATEIEVDGQYVTLMLPDVEARSFTNQWVGYCDQEAQDFQANFDADITRPHVLPFEMDLEFEPKLWEPDE